MTINSRVLTPNYTYQDLNLLRADVLDPSGGHDHDGVAGKKVNHSNLVHPNAYSPAYTHAQIDSHISALHGVHGATQGMYVPATRGQQWIVTGTVDIATNGAQWGHTTIWLDVNHKMVFADITYAVFVTPDTHGMGDNGIHVVQWFMPVINQKTTEKFEVWAKAISGEGTNTLRARWMAIGLPNGSYMP